MPTPDGQLNINEVGKLYEMFSDIKHIRSKVESLDKAMNGNGRPGIKQEVHDLKGWHSNNDNMIMEIVTRHKNETFLRKIISRSLYVATGGSVVGFFAILNYIDKLK